MKPRRLRTLRFLSLMIVVVGMTFISTRLKADTGTCGGATITLPFADVAAGNIFFCSIASAYFAGLTNGTTPTTYNPSDPVPREQMAAFVSRTLDQSVKRSNPRAALGEWWTNQSGINYRLLKTTGSNPRFLTCDGLTVWVSCTEADSVQRFDIRTGDLICTLTGIPSPEQIVVVGDHVWIASAQFQGRIYLARRNITTSTGGLSYIDAGVNPIGMTFDGLKLWIANDGNGPGTGSITSVNVSADPVVVTNFSASFSQPRGILFDGANLWVTDAGDTSLKRVDRNTGSVLQTIGLSGNVGHPIFDGTNLWVPCAATAGVPNQVFVVRAVGGLIGTVLATLAGNGLNGAFQAAFDGERICVTNASAPSVSLWKATDLSPIASAVLANTAFNSRGICSDGTAFFIGLRDHTSTLGIGVLTRF